MKLLECRAYFWPRMLLEILSSVKKAIPNSVPPALRNTSLFSAQLYLFTHFILFYFIFAYSLNE